MVAMVSILSITKKRTLQKIILGSSLLVGGASCSAPKVKNAQKAASLEESPAAKPTPKPEVKPKVIDAGPSQKPTKTGFRNVSKEVGLERVVATHLYAVDWNNDGLTDLVTLPEFYAPPKFFLNNGKVFKEIINSPLDASVRASFLIFADFNKDGLLDVIAATLNQKTELNQKPLRLFKAFKKAGKNVGYKEVLGAFPPKPYATASVSLIDINMDGKLDVFLGNWFDTTSNRPKVQTDRLYLAVEDGVKFKDASYYLESELEYNRDYSTYPNAVPTFGSSLCDLDKNGYPDILTASSSGYGNKVWLNQFDKKNDDRILKNFAKETGLAHDNDGAFSPTGGGNSFYMLCHDYNNDTFLDVAMGELFHSYDPESRDRSSIMTGKGMTFPPQFIRTEYHKDDGSGSWSQGDRRAIWADLNFDSYTDLVVENSGFPPKSRLVFFRQGQDHSYGDEANLFGIDIVNPSGSVVLDFNRDGRLDLFMGQVKLRNSTIKPRFYAFKNEFEWQGRRVLKINLKGKRANAHGIGALVHLRTNKGNYTKIHDPSYGPLNSQNQMGLWFGLKKGEEPIDVEVRWPLEKKTKSGKKYPYRKTYSLKNLKFKTFKEVTFKE